MKLNRAPVTKLSGDRLHGNTLWLARAAMGASAGFMVLRHWPALLAAPCTGATLK